MTRKASKTLINWVASFMSVALMLSMMALPALAVVAANSVNSRAIINGQVRTPDLAKDSVISSRIRNGTIKRQDIRRGEIVSGKIADGAVTSAKIRNRTISSVDIASVNESKINYATKTGYLNLSATDFNEDNTTWKDPRRNQTELTGAGRYYAPIHLPQGAKVTSIRMQSLDSTNGVTAYIRASLRRASGPASSEMANTGATSDVGLQTLVDGTVLNPVIDNKTYVYMVELGLFRTDPNLRLYNVRIDYTYTAPRH